MFDRFSQHSSEKLHITHSAHSGPRKKTLDFGGNQDHVTFGLR